MNIIWTLTAELTFEEEQSYILKKWNNEEVVNFVKLVYRNIERLKTLPFLGKDIGNNERSLVISKQTTLFYRIIDDNTIELMLFWNNLRNPKDLEFLLYL